MQSSVLNIHYMSCKQYICINNKKKKWDCTTDLDCLRREPLDLAEDSVCEDAWLGEGVPDWGHLSAAQSTSTHTGNTKPHTSVTFMFKIMTLSCTQFMQVHILPWAVSLMIIQERGPSLCAAPGHWTHTVHKFRVSHRIMWFSQNWHTVPKKDQAAEKSQSNLKKPKNKCTYIQVGIQSSKYVCLKRKSSSSLCCWHRTPLGCHRWATAAEELWFRVSSCQLSHSMTAALEMGWPRYQFCCQYWLEKWHMVVLQTSSKLTSRNTYWRLPIKCQLDASQIHHLIL